jgi:hypothetical protein
MLPDLSTTSSSQERLHILQQWLQEKPSTEAIKTLLEVYLNKDKGITKLLRNHLEHLDVIAENQLKIEYWVDQAKDLLAQDDMQISQALVWQRDVAKAKLSISEPPLLDVNLALTQKINQLEDLQKQILVHKESALLLINRIQKQEVQPLSDAITAAPGINEDIKTWLQEYNYMKVQRSCQGLEPRFLASLEFASQQLQTVWTAYSEALEQAQQALKTPSSFLPKGSLWLEEIQDQHKLEQTKALEQIDNVSQGDASHAIAEEEKQRAIQAIQKPLEDLEKALKQGRTKAINVAAQKVRSMLREYEIALEEEQRTRIYSTLKSATDLQDWQRWRTDQLRQNLIDKAKSLVDNPLKPMHQQKSLRDLRQEWKILDQSGPANQKLWHAFDGICNQAYRVVTAWLNQLKAQEYKIQEARQALICHITKIAPLYKDRQDWHRQQVVQEKFIEQWKHGGHLRAQHYQDLHKAFQEAMDNTFVNLYVKQEDNITARKQLIAQADTLAQAPTLDIKAIHHLQEQWTTLARELKIPASVENKLWNSFRRRINAAFAQQRAKRQANTDIQKKREAPIVQAIAEVYQANHQKDRQAIYAALNNLKQVCLKTPEDEPEKVAGEQGKKSTDDTAENTQANSISPSPEVGQLPTSLPTKKLVAVRGDDRPGRGEIQASTNKNLGKKTKVYQKNREKTIQDDRWLFSRGLQHRVQQVEAEAIQVLKNLSANAHTQAIDQLLDAWQQRNPALLPRPQDLGKKIKNQQIQLWEQVFSVNPHQQEPKRTQRSMLWLEIKNKISSPPEEHNERRQLQLEILASQYQVNHNHLPWDAYVSHIFASPYNESIAKRLQLVLAKLLR